VQGLFRVAVGGKGILRCREKVCSFDSLPGRSSQLKKAASLVSPLGVA
jgi:hypothetical protein